nr:hypothetical protein [uncultured Psychroserpens sp.]
MKNYILIIICFVCSTIVYSQDEQQLGVLESDTTWLKEIIKFPIGFAPEIKYTGYEDLRFAKQWRNQDSEDFWCYMFVWHVDGIQKPTTEYLEQQIKFYYDGIMKAVNKKKDFVVPETKVQLENSSDAEADLLGKIDVHDSFNTEDLITLNVQVKTYYCKANNTTNMVFKLSPQAFNGEIWERFKTVKLHDDVCEN